MSAYRFCRTDDIPLLVEAQRRCWLPHFPGTQEPTVEAFKREIRDLQVWCSSCMVASTGSEAVGVLIGAKRPTSTLVHRIAVHPDHLRQGHARHLLTSLSSKLAILGPPRLVAEVPEAMTVPRALFESCGYEAETTLTDYLLPAERSFGATVPPPDDTFLVPITMEDVEGNDLLASAKPGCWERARETVVARGEEVSGLAVATVNRIAALILHRSVEGVAEIEALLALPGEEQEDAEVFLACLVGLLARRHRGPIRFPKVSPEEVPAEWISAWGFQPAGTHVRYAATARSA